MAEVNPELQERLEELDRELEEGDITQKGYQKRRTQLFSQFLGSPPPQVAALAEPQSGLRIHSPDDSAHPSGDGHRAAAYASLGASSGPIPDTPDSPIYRPHSGYAPSSESLRPPEQAPASLLRPGGPMAAGSTAAHRDSLFFSPSHVVEPETRTGTMRSGDYAFRPEQQGAYPDQQYQQQQQYQQPPQQQPDGRTTTLLDSQGYFSDFAGQQHYDQGQTVEYGGPQQRYSSSLRNVEPAPQILEQEEYDQATPRHEYEPTQTMLSELPDGQETPTGFQHAQFEHPPQSAGSGPPTQLNLSHQPDQGLDIPDFSRYSGAEHKQGPVHRRPVPGHAPPPEPIPGNGQAPPQIRLPGVDGREEVSFWQQQNKGEKSEEDWTAEAIMHMNLAGDMNPR